MTRSNASLGHVDFGIAVVDKPEGMTSNAVLSRVRKIVSNKRAGHTGTLDPFATGVLVIGVGRATRLFPLLQAKRKRYSAILHLGSATDTADLTGNVVESCPIMTFSSQDLDRIAADLIGRQYQIPPAYSAKKIAGVPSHVLARQNRAVDLAPVEIEIFSLVLGAAESPGTVCVDVECSRGTYIRTLGEKIALELGTVGHLVSLRRTLSDGFEIQNAVALERFDSGSFIELERILADFAVARISDSAFEHARHGHPIPLGDVSYLRPSEAVGRDQGGLVAVFRDRPALGSLAVADFVGMYVVSETATLVARMLFVS